MVTIQEQRVEQLVRLRKENGENKAVYFQGDCDFPDSPPNAVIFLEPGAIILISSRIS